MSLANDFPSIEPAIDIRSWQNVPGKTARASISGVVVKDFAPLRDLAQLRSLNAICNTRAQLATVAELVKLEALSLNHHSLGLEPIGTLARLKVLRLDVFRSASLHGIEDLKGLRYLRVEHAPKLVSLEPLAALEKLEWLSISTPASWDASRRTIKVESLAPLANLSRLRHLGLTGVEPRSAGLLPLHNLQKLKQLDFSHVQSLAMANYAALAAALPRTRGNCLQPTYRLRQIPWLCRKCGATERVWLTAPPARTKNTQCPTCDAAKIAAHEAEFARMKAAAARRQGSP